MAPPAAMPATAGVDNDDDDVGPDAPDEVAFGVNEPDDRAAPERSDVIEGPFSGAGPGALVVWTCDGRERGASEPAPPPSSPVPGAVASGAAPALAVGGSPSAAVAV